MIFVARIGSVHVGFTTVGSVLLHLGAQFCRHAFNLQALIGRQPCKHVVQAGRADLLVVARMFAKGIRILFVDQFQERLLGELQVIERQHECAVLTPAGR